MKKRAFTLAEVLITLGIIGVVAALTMPSLIANYQKKVYVAQLQKAVNVWNNGMKLMLASDGVDNLADTEFGKIVRDTGYGCYGIGINNWHGTICC
jgi:prepilin-type N-terminal cleavage/methylation domain-containing protein